jgi:6-phosphogluconolactonase
MDVKAPTGTRIFASADALAQSAADWVCDLALARKRPLAVCLSAGSTPRKLREALASPSRAARFPWTRSHWFWGDERFVPRDHPDSNDRMARQALLARVPIAAENIHPIPTEGLLPGAAAAAYEATLKDFYAGNVLAAQRPLFDLTLLGVAEDGHTASLFPGQQSVHQSQRWVLEVISPNCDPRITLTLPPLQSSRSVAFLVTGPAKGRILASVWAGDPTLPAARLHPSGRLHWFVDRAATPAAGGSR